MTKQSVNLLIRQESESLIIRRLKIILPLASIISLTLFIISSLILVNYLNQNKNQFETTKKDVELLEKKIASQKNAEGIYTYTVSRLNILDKIISIKNNYFSLISEINNLPIEGITILSTTADEMGKITLSVTASSSGALDDFVTRLINKEEKKLFSSINASGIIREKKGNYTLTISFKGDQSLFK